MRVEECMIPCPMTVGTNEPLDQVAALIFHHHIPQIPVVDERNRLTGIITERDVLEGVQTRGSVPLVAEDVMTSNPETVTPGSSVSEAIDIFVRRRYGALPVVVGDRIVGLLGAHELLRSFVGSQGASEMEPV